MSVKRIWHGWTTPEKADEYQALLQREVSVGIEAMNIDGLTRFEMMRRDLGDEVRDGPLGGGVRHGVYSFVGQAGTPATASSMVRRMSACCFFTRSIWSASPRSWNAWPSHSLDR